MSGMKKFSLQSGAKLQLQFLDEPQRDRYQVTVIGYVEGRSLMITAPQKNGSLLLLREGQQFVVRLLSGKQIIGFNSEVTKVYNNPFSYVHLKPPLEVEQLVVRNAHRVELKIIATAHKIERDKESGEVIKPTSNKSTPAIVNNMSTTGCQIQIAEPLSADYREMMINTKITVADQERILTIEGEICSHREAEIDDKNWQLYGLKFNKMDDDRRLLLNCFVYEQLVKEIFNEQ
jgi:c-di-GMP-binding flagellar brake protein YcgR